MMQKESQTRHLDKSENFQENCQYIYKYIYVYIYIYILLVILLVKKGYGLVSA